VGGRQYWCLVGVFVTAGAMGAVRWAEDYHLIILGTLAFASAHLGRMARRGTLVEQTEHLYIA
jgi:hypothetical protein